MTRPPALFLPAGSGGTAWQPTEVARSPWAPDALHGGAPAALIAREVERHREGGEPPLRIVRLTVELLRPVPTTPLTVAARTVRGGRRVQLVEAVLRADGVDVCRAVALRLHETRLDLPLPAASSGQGDPLPPPAPPESGVPFDERWGWTAFHTDGMELRFVEGEFMAPGPATAWFRLRQPVVPGEAPSPFMRVAAAADFGNGLSQLLSMREWLFINPDLTVQVFRPPVDEWVCLRARTFLDASGAGVSESELYDRVGRVGRASQSLLLDRR